MAEERSGIAQRRAIPERSLAFLMLWRPKSIAYWEVWGNLTSMIIVWYDWGYELRFNHILLTLLGYIPGMVHAVWIIAKR